MKKFIKIFFLWLFLIAAAASALLFYVFLSPNVILLHREHPYLFVATGSGYENVLISMDTTVSFKSKLTFGVTSAILKYPKHVRAGRYKIYSGMNNLSLIRLLRSGQQDPVNLVFNSVRTKETFAAKISGQIEASEDSLNYLLSNKDFLSAFQLNANSVLTLFIPNTYKFFWNTSAKDFLIRMKKENEKFWTEERLQKTLRLGISKTEASILASIVEQETQRNDEKPMIAGVYMNRLKKNMKLEADPTLVFALCDFSVKRVLSEYKEIDSPFNTYKYSGLPPGPICIPSIASIDAVLNRLPHNFLYFCAKDDFSGYHAFASTYQQHLQNARKFHIALNRRGIRK